MKAVERHPLGSCIACSRIMSLEGLDDSVLGQPHTLTIGCLDTRLGTWSWAVQRGAGEKRLSAQGRRVCKESVTEYGEAKRVGVVSSQGWCRVKEGTGRKQE